MCILVEDTHTAFSGPSGWTLQASQDVGPFTAYIYKLRRTGSAPSYAVSWSTSRYYEWSVQSASGAVASGEFIDAAAAGAVVSTNSINGPAITTLTAETLIYAIAWTWWGWAGSEAAPSGYTKRFAASGYDHGIATKALATATSEDPAAWGNTSGSDATWSYTLAIASVAAAGTKAPPPARRPLRIFTRGRAA